MPAYCQLLAIGKAIPKKITFFAENKNVNKAEKWKNFKIDGWQENKKIANLKKRWAANLNAAAENPNFF